MTDQRMQRLRSRKEGVLGGTALHLGKRQGALTGVTGGIESGANKAGDKASSYTAGLNQWEILAISAAGVALIALVCTWTWLVCNRKRKAREAAKVKEEEEIAEAEKLRRTNTMTQQSSHGHHGSAHSHTQRKSLLANAAPAGMTRGEALRVNTASAVHAAQGPYSPHSPGPRDAFLPASPNGERSYASNSGAPSSSAFGAPNVHAAHYQGEEQAFHMQTTSPNNRRSYHQVIYPDQPLPQSVDLRQPLPFVPSASPPRASYAQAPHYDRRQPSHLPNPYAELDADQHNPFAHRPQAQAYDLPMSMPMPDRQRPASNSYAQAANRTSHYGAAL